MKGRVLDGKFSGSLSGASIRSMLKASEVRSGSGTGDLRFTIDLDQPRRTSAQGNLKGEALDLTLLLDRP